LLFLAAGSVIHAMGGEQDMLKMGGLRKKIPVTYWTMLAATLAITGFPPFSGFFSKDEILFSAYAGPYENKLLWAVGLAAALLTSFYMFRLLFLTFFGAPRYDEHKVHMHESPKSMLVPLVILAILATTGGWIAAPKFWGGQDYFHNYLAPVFASADKLAPSMEMTEEGAHTLELELSGVAVLITLIGFFVAWWFYVRKPQTPKKLAASLSAPYTLLWNKYYVDEIYAALVVRPLLWISTNVFWHVVDERVIDGAVNGSAHVAREVGGELRKLQSGNERSYAAWIVIGAVGFTVLLVGLWLRVR
jgi:NADH-quinone oxidoreductase subunit L